MTNILLEGKIVNLIEISSTTYNYIRLWQIIWWFDLTNLKQRKWKWSRNGTWNWVEGVLTCTTRKLKRHLIQCTYLRSTRALFFLENNEDSHRKFRIVITRGLWLWKFLAKSSCLPTNPTSEELPKYIRSISKPI